MTKQHGYHISHMLKIKFPKVLAKNYLNINALINLYPSYIYPYLIYWIEARGDTTNCHLEQLYLIQKKVTRMFSFSNYNTHSIDIFKQLNILPLNKLVVNRIGLMMYKHANNLLSPAINDLCIENCEGHNYPTRQKHLLHVNKSNINIYSKVLETQVLAYGMLCSPKLR